MSKKYLFSMFLFLLYLVTSNKIIYLSNNVDFPIEKIIFDSESLPIDYNSVHHAIDDLYYISTLHEELFIRGWAFYDVVDSNEKRNIFLILSGSTSYQIPLALDRRGDVVNYYSLPDFYSNNLGFFADFSTITIKNGVYDIYLYVKENEEVAGYIKTDKRIVKDYNGIREWTPPEPSEVAIPSHLEENEEISLFIDSKNLSTTGGLSIQGWSFMEEIETENQNVYLLFTQKNGIQFMYETTSVLRTDVGTAYDNPKYNQSGFSLTTTLSPNKYDLESLSFQVVIEEGGVYHLSGKIHNFEEESKALVDEVPVKDTNTSVEIPETIYETEMISFYIDALIMEETQGITVRGWTFFREEETETQSVYLLFTDDEGNQLLYETNKESRPDVGSHFENELYNNAGFQGVIPTTDSHFNFPNSTMQIIIELRGEYFLNPTSIQVYNKNEQ